MAKKKASTSKKKKHKSRNRVPKDVLNLSKIAAKDFVLEKVNVTQRKFNKKTVEYKQDFFNRATAAVLLQKNEFEEKINTLQNHSRDIPNIMKEISSVYYEIMTFSENNFRLTELYFPEEAEEKAAKRSAIERICHMIINAHCIMLNNDNSKEIEKLEKLEKLEKALIFVLRHTLKQLAFPANPNFTGHEKLFAISKHAFIDKLNIASEAFDISVSVYSPILNFSNENTPICKDQYYYFQEINKYLVSINQAVEKADDFFQLVLEATLESNEVIKITPVETEVFSDQQTENLLSESAESSNDDLALVTDNKVSIITPEATAEVIQNTPESIDRSLNGKNESVNEELSSERKSKKANAKNRQACSTSVYSMVKPPKSVKNKKQLLDVSFFTKGANAKKAASKNNTHLDQKPICFGSLNLKNNKNIIDLSKDQRNTYVFPNIDSLRKEGMPEHQIAILKSKLDSLSFSKSSMKQLKGKGFHNVNFNSPEGKTCNAAITHEFRGLAGLDRIAIFSVLADDNKSTLYVFAKYLQDGLHFLPRNQVLTGNVTIDWCLDASLKSNVKQEKNQQALPRAVSAYDLKMMRSKAFRMNLFASEEPAIDSNVTDNFIDNKNCISLDLI